MDIISITDMPMNIITQHQQHQMQPQTTSNIFFSQQPAQQLSTFHEQQNIDQQINNNLHTQPQDDTDCFFFNFLWACALMVLCYLGYIGNILSFLALNRDRRNSATMLLQALSISDIVLLISVNITDAVPYYCDYVGSCVNPWKFWPQIRYIWILTPIGHMCSIWLVVLVAANRYWAVCKPYSAAETWSNQKTLIYIIAAITTAFLFNIPRFYEYEIVDKIEPGLSFKNGSEFVNNSNQSQYSVKYELLNGDEIGYPKYINDDDVIKRSLNDGISQHNLNKNITLLKESNETSQETTTYKRVEQTTKFGQSKLYKVGYKVILVNIFLVIIPIPLQFITSIWIIRSLKLSVQRSRSTTSSKKTLRSVKSGSSINDGADNNGIKNLEEVNDEKHRKNLNNDNAVDKNLDVGGSGRMDNDGKMVSSKRGGSSSRKAAASREITFLLVAVVLVAVACQTPLALFHFVRYTYIYGCGDLVYYLESASKFLVNVNSCINFVLYCVLSPKFRRLLMSLVKCQSAENKKHFRPLMNNDRSLKIMKSKSTDADMVNKSDERKNLLKKITSKDEEEDKEGDDETKALVAVVVAETPISTKIQTIATDDNTTATEMAALLSNNDEDNDDGKDEKSCR